MSKCIYCGKQLFLKKAEAYKKFYLCTTKGCHAVSIIVTTTSKLNNSGEMTNE